MALAAIHSEASQEKKLLIFLIASRPHTHVRPSHCCDIKWENYVIYIIPFVVGEKNNIFGGRNKDSKFICRHKFETDGLDLGLQ